MSLIRSDLAQWFQYEFPFVHLYMGDAEVILCPYKIIVENNIQVQSARSPAEGPLPPGSLLDTVELVQQFPRGEQGLKLQAAVEEVRLVCDAVGRSLPGMRDPAYSASPDLIQ